jgi:hypothetical protein
LGGIDPLALRVWLLALVGLMGIAHVASAMYRSGSRLFSLDLGLGALFVAAIVALGDQLTAAGAGEFVVDRLGPVTVAAVATTTLAAAAAQLAFGRADPERGHKALSAALWALALVSLGAFTLWGRWVLRVTPAEVGGASYPLSAAPRGTAVFFRGDEARGRAGFSPVFLLDGQSGKYLRLPPERMTPPAFSADGRLAAWVAPPVPWWWYAQPYAKDRLPEPGAPGTALAVAWLDRAEPIVEEHPLEDPGSARAALAVDGQRVVVSGRSSVDLVDATSGRPLAKASLPDVEAADFLPDGAVRLYQRQTGGPARASLVVLDWRAKEGSTVERARVSGELHGLFLFTRRGDLAVVWTGVRGKAILDAGTGTVRSYESARPEAPGAAVVLSGDRVALSLGSEVRILSRSGDTVARIPLETEARVYALRETMPGELAVGLWSRPLEDRRTLIVDAATGAIRREEKGLLPAFSPWASQAEPGSFASRLFSDLAGGLVILEPDGRRREVVAPGD